MSDETQREDPHPEATEQIGHLLARLLPSLETLQLMARQMNPATLPSDLATITQFDGFCIIAA